MNDARERMEQLRAGLNSEERHELRRLVTEEIVSDVKLKGKAFLAGLDANDRDRLKALGMAAFEKYVTELPGPNEFVKGKVRPAVETALENAIADWCS